jgi:hypothetical protein
MREAQLKQLLIWPAVIFAGALVVVTVLTLVSSGPGWCADKEAAIVCAREWTNSAGNLIAVLVAVGAAFLAYRVAKHQADIAAIPRITERLEKLQNVQLIVNLADTQTRTCRMNLRFLEHGLKQAEMPGIFQRAWKELGTQLEGLRKQFRALDTEARAVAGDARVTSLVQQARTALLDYLPIAFIIVWGGTTGRDQELDQSNQAAEKYFQLAKVDPSLITDTLDLTEKLLSNLASISQELSALRQRLDQKLESIDSRS